MLTPQDMLFGVGILIALALFTLWDRCTRKSGGAPSYPTPKECTTEGCTNFGNGLAEDSGQCNACAKKI